MNGCSSISQLQFNRKRDDSLFSNVKSSINQPVYLRFPPKRQAKQRISPRKAPENSILAKQMALPVIPRSKPNTCLVVNKSLTGAKKFSLDSQLGSQYKSKTRILPVSSEMVKNSMRSPPRERQTVQNQKKANEKKEREIKTFSSECKTVKKTSSQRSPGKSSQFKGPSKPKQV